MKSEAELLTAITGVYAEYAAQDTRVSTRQLTADTILTGPTGLLDSMSIVAFLMNLEDKMGVTILDQVMAEVQKNKNYQVRDLISLLRK